VITLDAPTESPPPVFEEALRWFRGRVPMTDAAFAALSVEAQRRAFTLAGVAALTVVSDVWRSLDATLAAGRTLRDFKRDVAPALLGEWQGSVAAPAWRMEVIFRNATQRAYVHGRVEQLRDPEVAPLRPVWMFDAVGDARTSAICTALDGTVLAASDPWWASHTPPCHHACRSTLRGLRASDPRAKAAAGQAPPTVDAQKGFGELPGADDWQPREGDYPAPAWRAYQGNPQAYRAPAPRAPTREMPVFTPPAAPAPKPRTPTIEAPAFVPPPAPKAKTPTAPMPVFAPPKASPPAPAAKPAPAPKAKAAPKVKAPPKPKVAPAAPPPSPARMVGPVVLPPPPSGAYRDPSTISPREAAPRMTGGPAPLFGDLDINPMVEGRLWADHDARDYPENHLTPDYANRVYDESRVAFAALTPEQKTALRDYTGATYEPLNAYLRDPALYRKRNGAAAASKMRELARVTHEAMATMPRAPSDVVLFRGLSLSRRDDKAQMDAMATTGEVTLPSFGSFTRSPRTARAFAAQKDASVVYRIRSHRSGVMMEGISSVPGEREVLFPPGTRFRVVARQRVNPDQLVVDLEEITDD
jgi:SPP1 gp7 family putative phage head morphogenesis protein